MKIQVGKGSALLVDSDSNSVYMDVSEIQRLNSNRKTCYGLKTCLTAERKVPGSRFLKKALTVARSQNMVLCVFVMNSKEGGDSGKLRDWYLGTGLLVQAPTPRGTRLQNILIDKQARVEAREESLDT